MLPGYPTSSHSKEFDFSTSSLGVSKTSEWPVALQGKRLSTFRLGKVNWPENENRISKWIKFLADSLILIRNRWDTRRWTEIWGFAPVEIAVVWETWMLYSRLNLQIRSVYLSNTNSSSKAHSRPAAAALWHDLRRIWTDDKLPCIGLDLADGESRRSPTSTGLAAERSAVDSLVENVERKLEKRKRTMFIEHWQCYIAKRKRFQSTVQQAPEYENVVQAPFLILYTKLACQCSPRLQVCLLAAARQGIEQCWTRQNIVKTGIRNLNLSFWGKEGLKEFQINKTKTKTRRRFRGQIGRIAGFLISKDEFKVSLFQQRRLPQGRVA